MFEKQYTASRVFSWGLTVAVAIMAAAGVPAMFTPDQGSFLGFDKSVLTGTCVFAFTAAVVFCICLSNCMACHAQRAIAGEKKFKGLFWAAATMAAFLSLASMAGVELCWLVLKSMAPAQTALIPDVVILIGAGILAVIKPLTQFITEGATAVSRQHHHEEQLRRDERYAARMSVDHSVSAAPVAATPPAPPAVVETPAAAPVVASIGPFGVKLHKSAPTEQERALVAPAVAGLCAAVLAGGFAAIVQRKEEAPAPAVYTAELTAETELDGLTLTERSVVYGLRFEKVKAFRADGFDVSDIVAATGYPASTVRKWIGQIQMDEHNAKVLAKVAGEKEVTIAA